VKISSASIRRKVQSMVLNQPRFVQRILSFPLGIYASYSQKKRLQKSVQEALSVVEKTTKNARQRVLIDCGFNNGKSLDEFITQFPDDFIFYGFECQADLSSEVGALLEKHNNRKVSLDFSAISDHDGEIDILISKEPVWGGMYRGIGSTIFEGRTLEGHSEYSDVKTCNAIDFSEKLVEIYKTHTTPSGEPPIIVVKMNVEGAEYPALHKVVQQGDLNKISLLTIEFHKDQFPDSGFERQHADIKRALEQNNITCLNWAS